MPLSMPKMPKAITDMGRLLQRDAGHEKMADDTMQQSPDCAYPAGAGVTSTPGAGPLRRECRVLAVKDFGSANREGAAWLRKGERGTVLDIDADGDARVLFDDHARGQWVLKVSFKALAVTQPTRAEVDEVVGKLARRRQETVDDLIIVMSNLLQNPDEPKYRRLPKNGVFCERMIRHARTLLLLTGFESAVVDSTGENVCVLTGEVDTEVVTWCLRSLQEARRQYRAKSSAAFDVTLDGATGAQPPELPGGAAPSPTSFWTDDAVGEERSSFDAICAGSGLGTFGA